MSELAARSGDVIPARIVSEDDEFMLIEVGKHDSTSFTLQDGDRFVTLVFVRQIPGARPGRLQAWKPWA